MFENDIKIDQKMNRKIRNDWAAEFQNLKKDKHTVLRRRVGPLLISLWHQLSYGTDISPRVSYFNLCNPLKEGYICATFQITMMDLPGQHTQITWKQHEEGLYKAVANEFRQYVSIPLEGPVKLSQIIHAYQTRKSFAADEGYEDPALIAAYCGRLELAEECLKKSMQAYKDIGGTAPKQFKGTLEEWENSLLARIQNPDALRRITEEQVAFHKLKKIPYEDIVVDI